VTPRADDRPRITASGISSSDPRAGRARRWARAGAARPGGRARRQSPALQPARARLGRPCGAPPKPFPVLPIQSAAGRAAAGRARRLARRRHGVHEGARTGSETACAARGARSPRRFQSPRARVLPPGEDLGTGGRAGWVPGPPLGVAWTAGPCESRSRGTGTLRPWPAHEGGRGVRCGVSIRGFRAVVVGAKGTRRGCGGRPRRAGPALCMPFWDARSTRAACLVPRALFSFSTFLRAPYTRLAHSQAQRCVSPPRARSRRRPSAQAGTSSAPATRARSPHPDLCDSSSKARKGNYRARSPASSSSDDDDAGSRSDASGADAPSDSDSARSADSSASQRG
jgi:hypothetical protein